MNSRPLTDLIKSRYNRVAPLYDAMEAFIEAYLFKSLRAELLSTVSGRVLEVGVGTGKNLSFYPNNIDLYAIDFSAGMLRRPKQRANTTHSPAQLFEMDVQKLGFPDSSLDFVVTSFVFCSVPDPIKGLKEIHRVLKPGGQLLMLEHVRSQLPILGNIMDWLDFMPYYLYGAHINRDTENNLLAAGFSPVRVRGCWIDIVKQFQYSKHGL